MSTNSLIITGGTAIGVMKLVGEAISLKSDAIKEPTVKLLVIAAYERVNSPFNKQIDVKFKKIFLLLLYEWSKLNKVRFQPKNHSGFKS